MYHEISTLKTIKMKKIILWFEWLVKEIKDTAKNGVSENRGFR